MPRSTAQNIPHVAWTDHRILRRPETESPADQLVHGDVLTPIFSPAATSRDLALAYYSTAVQGKPADREKAYKLLTHARQTNPNDLEVLGSLGILTETSGDYSQAASIFREMLRLDATNLTAASNLGVLLARTEDLQGALALLRPAFNRNEDMIGLAKNLTAVECRLGDGNAARTTFETTLAYSPGSKDVLNRLEQTASCAAGRK